MSLNKWYVLVLSGMLLLCAAVPTGCKKEAEESEEAEEESRQEEEKRADKTEKLKAKKGNNSKKNKSKKKSPKDSLPAAAVDKAIPVGAASKAIEKTTLPESGKDEKEKPTIPEDSARDSKHKPPVTNPPGNVKAIPAPPVRVPVARYLTVIDLNEHLTEKGWIAYGPVQGIPPSETFNSLIYRRPGTARFVSILVWDFEQYAQAIEKWSALLATYPNAQELKDMFSKYLFFSYRNQVISLTFLKAEKAMVLSLSCHTEVCDDTALYELAKAVDGRASR